MWQTFASQRNIEVHSQQTGILQDVYVSEGQFVKAGQPLFRIAIVGANEEMPRRRQLQSRQVSTCRM